MARTGAKLGQHFLIHSWAARSLAHAALPRPDETILEIGPGKGMLTRELLAFGNRVIAIEKDPTLVEKLRETFPDEIAAGHLQVFEHDVRDFDPTTLTGPYVLAANIPYYITGEIIRQFLEAAHQPRAMALLVQKEVAQRITAQKESILSLSVKAYGHARIIEKVPARHFSPPPRVDSAILLIENISKDFFTAVDEEKFFSLLHVGFASKRKMLGNNLSVRFPRERVVAALEIAKVAPTARPEDVSLDAWKTIARFLAS